MTAARFLKLSSQENITLATTGMICVANTSMEMLLHARIGVSVRTREDTRREWSQLFLGQSWDCQANSYLMNKGTVKHFYLPLLCFPVFITKLQNPERNLTPLRCSLFHVHRPDTHPPSASTRSEEPTNGKHINIWVEAIWWAGDSARIQDLGIQTLSSFLQAVAAKWSHLWLISVARVVKALFIAPHSPRKIQQRQHPQPPGTALEQGLGSSSIPQPGITPGAASKGYFLPEPQDHGFTCSSEPFPALVRRFCSSTLLRPWTKRECFPFLNRFGEECAKEELHIVMLRGEVLTIFILTEFARKSKNPLVFFLLIEKYATKI